MGPETLALERAEKPIWAVNGEVVARRADGGDIPRIGNLLVRSHCVASRGVRAVARANMKDGGGSTGISKIDAERPVRGIDGAVGVQRVREGANGLAVLACYLAARGMAVGWSFS